MVNLYQCYLGRDRLGEYGVFPSKYELLSYSDTTAKSSELKALLCSHSIGKNVILQGSKKVIPSLL